MPTDDPGGASALRAQPRGMPSPALQLVVAESVDQRHDRAVGRLQVEGGAPRRGHRDTQACGNAGQDVSERTPGIVDGEKSVHQRPWPTTLESAREKAIASSRAADPSAAAEIRKTRSSPVMVPSKP